MATGEMGYFTRPVIERTPGVASPLPRLLDEVMTPAKLTPGQRFGIVEVLDWEHLGDHYAMRIAWHARGGPVAAVAAGAGDDALEPHPEDGRSGRFEQKIAAIDKAVALGFRVKITCVVMKPNVVHVPRFAQFAWDRWGERLDRLQFSYAMPRGNAWLRPEWLLSFSDCVEPWQQAYELGRRTGMRVETSQSATYAPCVMPDYIDHQDLYGDFAGTTADVERVKPPEVCDGCAFDRVCAGGWQRYIDVFGTDELRAITVRPPPDVQLEDFRDATVLAMEDGG